MNRYVCMKCGRYSYSAAKLGDMRNKECVYVGCDGEVTESEGKQ